MQKYNKAIGSGLGSALGIVISAILLATLTQLGIVMTDELSMAVSVIGIALGGIIGTVLAKQNVY